MDGFGSLGPRAFDHHHSLRVGSVYSALDFLLNNRLCGDLLLLDDFLIIHVIFEFNFCLLLCGLQAFLHLVQIINCDFFLDFRARDQMVTVLTTINRWFLIFICFG